jgi:hypothetical protein
MKIKTKIIIGCAIAAVLGVWLQKGFNDMDKTLALPKWQSSSNLWEAQAKGRAEAERQATEFAAKLKIIQDDGARSLKRTQERIDAYGVHEAIRMNKQDEEWEQKWRDKQLAEDIHAIRQSLEKK